MSHNEPKDTINRMIYQAMVPKGLRPKTNEDIESMLDTIGGETYTAEKKQRMMQKIKGQYNGPCEDETIFDHLDRETVAHENELMAVYRDEGEDISPDSKQKLDDMRKRARKPKKNTEDGEPEDGKEDEDK